MIKRPNKPGYKVLESLSSPMQQRVSELDSRELAAALQAIGELTTSNCGWFVWELRDVLHARLERFRTDRLVPVLRCSRCEGAARLTAGGVIRCCGGPNDPQCTHIRRLRRGELEQIERAADEHWRKARRREAQSARRALSNRKKVDRGSNSKAARRS